MPIRGRFWVVGLVLLSIACRTPVFRPVDMSQPGWKVRQGQAVWRPRRGQAEIAGELLMAESSRGESLVQFTKNPFPLVVARTSPDGWRIEFIPRSRVVSGQGTPPVRRVVWFLLPNAVGRHSVSPPWEISSPQPGTWRIENPSTGESLEGFLFNE